MYFVSSVCSIFIKLCKSRNYLVLDKLMDYISSVVEDSEYHNLIDYHLQVLALEYPDVLKQLEERINKIAKEC